MTENKVRVLFLDVETSPIVGYSWSSYDTNLLRIIEPSKIMSIAWKWAGESEEYVKCLFDCIGYKPGQIDDKELIEKAWKLLDEADVVCTQNGNAFDLPRLYARFVYYKLGAPSGYETIDTLKIARKYFKFDQNSLDSLADYLGVGRKINNTGFELWEKCIAGDEKAWDLMCEYNLNDVVLLEGVYLRLRPYMNGSHPNLALISNSEEAACPTCLSKDIQKRGYSVTKTGRKQRYQCSACSSWFSGPYIRVKSKLQ